MQEQGAEQKIEARSLEEQRVVYGLGMKTYMKIIRNKTHKVNINK